jgi:hypothetical protein
MPGSTSPEAELFCYHISLSLAHCFLFRFRQTKGWVPPRASKKPPCAGGFFATALAGNNRCRALRPPCGKGSSCRSAGTLSGGRNSRTASGSSAAMRWVIARGTHTGCSSPCVSTCCRRRDTGMSCGQPSCAVCGGRGRAACFGRRTRNRGTPLPQR